MEYFGAGLAALGVIGPGIGVGIIGGLSAQAIGRNPDAAGQIRGIAIILAAFAEGLGVLAIVVGLLGLEVMLNAIQALIFSVLTLIFITLAIESHEHEEGHVADEAMETLHDTEPATLQPAQP